MAAPAITRWPKSQRVLPCLIIERVLRVLRFLFVSFSLSLSLSLSFVVLRANLCPVPKPLTARFSILLQLAYRNGCSRLFYEHLWTSWVRECLPMLLPSANEISQLSGESSATLRCCWMDNLSELWMWHTQYLSLSCNFAWHGMKCSCDVCVAAQIASRLRFLRSCTSSRSTPASFNTTHLGQSRKKTEQSGNQLASRDPRPMAYSAYLTHVSDIFCHISFWHRCLERKRGEDNFDETWHPWRSLGFIRNLLSSSSPSSRWAPAGSRLRPSEHHSWSWDL